MVSLDWVNNFLDAKECSLILMKRTLFSEGIFTLKQVFSHCRSTVDFFAVSSICDFLLHLHWAPQAVILAVQS